MSARSSTASPLSVHRLSHWSQRLMVIIFHLLIIIVPFIFTWVNEELFEFNKMMVTYAGAATIGCLWISRMIVEERVIFRRSYLDIPLLLFAVSQIISTIFSIHPYTSVFGYYTRFHGGLLSILTYILLYYAFISNVPRSHLPKLFLSLCLTAVGVSLYAIPEHFGYSPSCLLISGGQQADVSCWIQDVKNRVFGPFGQPNWLAAYAITIIPVSLALTINSWKTSALWQKILFVSCTWGLFLTLLFTRSRSGFLGLLVGGAVFAIGYVVLVLKQRLTDHRLYLPLGLSVGLIALSIVIFGTPQTPSLTQLLSSTVPVTETTAPTDSPTPVVNRLEEGGTQSSEIRRIVWTGALEVAKRHPWFGTGVETFAYSYYQDRPAAHNLVSEWDFLYNKAHNEFLNYLATTGVVGVLTYSSLLGWFGWVAAKVVWSKTVDSQTQLLTLGLAAGIVGLTISNALGFSTVMVTILMFWYFGILELIKKPAPTQSSLPSQSPARSLPSAPLQPTQWVGLSLTALAGLYIWWSIMTIWTADRAYAQGKQLIRAGETSAGLNQLQSAVIQSPGEALYYDELSSTYAALAVEYARQSDATTASQLAQAAITTSDKTLELNDRHLNFYKTRVRIFITLAQLKPDWLNNAQETLVAALALAPTDAKLMYNLALVQLALGDQETGLQTLKKTIELKPNYEGARVELAKHYQAAGQFELAKNEYRYILENITPNNELVFQQLTALEASTSSQTPNP